MTAGDDPLEGPDPFEGPEDPFGDEPFDDEPADDGPAGDQAPFGIPGLPNFLAPGFDLSNLDPSMLMHVLASPGPLNWEVASQLAQIVATNGSAEPAPDEPAGVMLGELARAAQTHVVAETGLAATFTTTVRTVTRAEWAALHLRALRPVLEALAESLGAALRAETGGSETAPLDPRLDPQIDPHIDPMNPETMLPMLAPLLLGVQAGSMIGYLAQHALGRYDLPLPSADEPSLCFVVANIEAFEREWSLASNDLRFYVAIHEVVHAATRSVPWVRELLVELAIEYVSSYEMDPSVLEARLGDLDPTNPESMQRLAEHPGELLGALQSERQRRVLEQVRVFHSVLDGYADVILERVGQPLIPSFAQIHEAMARHRLERGDAEQFVEGLLGLAVGRDDYELGAAFCRGVIERAGIDGLNRLWAKRSMVPTANELRAAGLWLARIELP